MSLNTCKTPNCPGTVSSYEWSAHKEGRLCVECRAKLQPPPAQTDYVRLMKRVNAALATCKFTYDGPDNRHLLIEDQRTDAQKED